MSRKLLEAYYRTYNREDPEALAAFYHDEVELESAQGTLRGVEAILDTYRYLTARFHDCMTPLHIALEGDHAEVDILDRFTAKQDVEDFMGHALKAGDAMNLRLKGSYRIADGKLRAIRIAQVAEPEVLRYGAAD